MRIPMIRVFLAAMVIALLPAIAAVTAHSAEGANGPAGLWLTEKEGVIVDLYPCGEDELCGRTVWLKKMNHKNGEPRLDENNPDPALRERHWCGIEVITGLEEDEQGAWRGGLVYDPKTGETFDFEITPAGEKLNARGYLGVPLLGKSETWTRAEQGDREFCADPV